MTSGEDKLIDLKNKTNLLIILFIIFLIGISFNYFLLFHSLVELISVVISYIIFVIAFYSRDKTNNYFLIFLGIAFGFIGTVDLLHTLAYKGMGVFSKRGANLPTQLWVIARYMESISYAFAFYFIGKKNIKKRFNINKIFTIFFIVTIIIFITLYFNIFPGCFIEGSGLTTFKIISEYIISIILIFALILLRKNKDYFDKKVYNLIFLSIILNILSEISFTFYVDVYGLSNITGHIFRLISVILVFKAIIETGFQKPYDIIFRELKKQKDQSEREKRFVKAIYNNLEQGICVHQLIYNENEEPVDYKIIDANDAYQKILNIPKDKAIGSLASKLYNTKPAPYLDIYAEVAKTQKPTTFEVYYAPMEKYFKINVTSHKKGQFITLFSDITETKQKEAELKTKYKEVKELSEKLEGIIYLSNRLSIDTKIDIEDFLKEVLEISLELMDEADYGSVSILKENTWQVIKSINYQKDTVQQLNQKRDILFKSEDNIFRLDLILVNNNNINKYLDLDMISEELKNYLDKISKYIKESIFFDIYLKENEKIRISLDIAAGSNQEFNKTDEKLLKAFRNMIYIFINLRKNKENTNSNEKLFEDE